MSGSVLRILNEHGSILHIRMFDADSTLSHLKSSSSISSGAFFLASSPSRLLFSCLCQNVAPAAPPAPSSTTTAPTMPPPPLAVPSLPVWLPLPLRFSHCLSEVAVGATDCLSSEVQTRSGKHPRSLFHVGGEVCHSPVAHFALAGRQILSDVELGGAN